MPLNTAIRLIEQGISVIPIGPNKRPLVAWEQYQHRIADEEEVREWFERWPDANLGIVTGALSNITVVDTDNEDADEWWRANGQPSPLMVKTGKGRHYYYSHGGERNAATWKGMVGLDVRGEGGYVVAPPSLHPSGARYEFVGVVEFDELPPLVVIGHDSSLFADKLPSLKGVDVEGQRVADKLADGPKLREGDGRNQVLTEYVGELVARGLSDDEVVVLASAFQDARFEDHLDEREMTTIIRSIRNTDKRKHPEKYAEDGTVSTVTYDDGTTLPTKVPGLMSATALIGVALPPRVYLIEPWLMKPTIVQLYGPSGHGKSMVAMGGAVSLACGKNFGPYRVSGQAKVLYVDFDMGAHDQQGRMRDYISMIGDPGENFQLLSLAMMGRASYDLDIRTEDGVKRLVHACRVTGADVVFLDNIRTLCVGMKEASADEWSVINKGLIALRNAGLSVVYIHHSNKPARDQTGKLHAGSEAGSGNQLTPLEVQVYVSKLEESADQFQLLANELDMLHPGGGYLRHAVCVDYGKVRDRDSALHTTEYMGFGKLLAGDSVIVSSAGNRRRAIAMSMRGTPTHEIARTLKVDKPRIEEWLATGW